ncbi:uncharacterized protein LOC34623267 [Cyclospora cayetanensis]|uniref:Uncharacterized protein n=2 Tax=Cyclospora cayetanensis TaxID=88456 RepID=A0A1D3D000_9EIME|nr:uncharacterized protein LOC34623267 [Cyclospora cayetanensis]OEH76755.1 hypothetical protein cyc_07271 [Cyclospora cayetanensis]
MKVPSPVRSRLRVSISSPSMCRLFSSFLVFAGFLLFAHASVAPKPTPSSGKASSEKQYGAEGERGPTHLGRLHEYKRVGADLVGLWREYTAMTDALSHAMRDYNVAIRQEQRAELSRVLATKHQKAEALVLQQKKHGGSTFPTSRIYGDIASLKEIKKQMKRLEKKVGQIPPYSRPEENVMMIQAGTTPVNVARALSQSSAILFHKSFASYFSHLITFKREYDVLHSSLFSMKTTANGTGRKNLIKEAAEHSNFYDPEAPFSLHLHKAK